MVGRANNNSNANGGLAYANANNASSNSNGNNGSRLANSQSITNRLYGTAHEMRTAEGERHEPQ